jgi:aspartate carbamoyltransferase catalytic subunit
MKVDMVVMRHPSPGASVFLSNNVKSCIINAGDGCHEHPTQALLDAFTLRSKFGSLNNKKILITGDILHSRVALSNIFIYKKLGAIVKVCGPKSLIPKYINELGVDYEPNFDNGLKWCDVASMLRIQKERMKDSYFPSNREYATQYGLDLNRLNKIDKEIVITHPGPINRGVELNSDVIDNEKTVILDQVENGVAVRMAIMYLLAAKL